jgi:hypothetical protein
MREVQRLYKAAAVIFVRGYRAENCCKNTRSIGYVLLPCKGYYKIAIAYQNHENLWTLRNGDCHLQP